MAIDDFSFLKGSNYGTIFIDHNTHFFIDALDTRTKNKVSERLKSFVNVKIVTRDRGKSYGSSIKEALPNAKQIADIFHLDENLTDKVKEYIKSKLPQDFYFNEKYNLIKEKKNKKYVLHRNKIISIIFKGFGILKENEKRMVKEILKENKEIKIVINQVLKFRNITNNRDERSFKKLLKKWRNSQILLLRTFMKGIDLDIEAVLNCIKYKETNGLAEGKINKLKTIKRMLYGRASNELLKSRLFLSDYFHSIE